MAQGFCKGGACPFGPHRKGANCKYCGGTGRVKKNWGTFFRLAVDDKPVQEVVDWARRTYEQGHYEVVIVSGRPDTYGDDTIAWLHTHGVRFHHIFMRRGRDKRPDTQVKREILERLPYERVNFIVDDRPSVLRMWYEFRRLHELNYEIHDVGRGEEF